MPREPLGCPPLGRWRSRTCFDEALELLDSGVPVSAERARAGQIKAREIGDDDALAIWSILRIRALVAMGSKELSL